MLKVPAAALLILITYLPSLAGSPLQDTLSYPRRPLHIGEAYTELEQHVIQSHYYGTLNLVEDLFIQLCSWEQRYGQRPAFTAFADSVELYRATLAKELASVRQRARTGYDSTLSSRERFWGPTEPVAKRWLEELDVRLHLRTTVERIRDSTDPTWAP